MNVVALPAAARPRALHQLAVLARPRHGAQVVPQRRLPQLPAHRHPGAHRRAWGEYERVRRHAGRRPAASRTARKIWWDVRPASHVPDARVPRLRRLHARRRGGVHRRDPPGDRVQALEDAPRQHHVPHLRVAAHRGEQVARGALRPRRQAHRLRQASSELPARELIREMHRVVPRRRGWTSSGRARRSSTRSRSSRTARAPTASSRSIERTGDLRAVVDQLIAETAEGVREPLACAERRASTRRAASGRRPTRHGDRGGDRRRSTPASTARGRRRPTRHASTDRRSPPDWPAVTEPATGAVVRVRDSGVSWETASRRPACRRARRVRLIRWM